MEVKYVKTFNLSWKNVFNSDLKYLPRWGSMDKARTAAKEAGYSFYVWNGWVFETTAHGSTSDRLIEASKLNDDVPEQEIT